MLRYRRIRQTTFIAVFCSALLLGLVLSKAGLELHGWLWLVVAGSLFVSTLRKQWWVLAPLIASGLMLGGWRGTETIAGLSIYSDYIGKSLTIEGRVQDDPVSGARGNYEFTLQSLKLEGIPVIGSAQVSTRDDILLQRGDKVVVSGKMREGFGSVQASISYGDVLSVEHARDPIMQFRNQFAAGVREAMGEPQASLALGFVIGERSALPTSIDDQMKLIGLTHIVVASGYNLTILIRIARRLFANHSKYMTLLSSCVLMGGFLLVTGFSPSMVRASLVTGLAIWAWYYGRHAHPLVLILFAASVTAYINPVYIWSDIGWYLSFLAFAGVLLLAPLVQRSIFGTKEVPLLSQVAIETISAQIATLPILLFIFGKLANLSVIANVLVVPFIPFAMLATFIAGVIGILAPALAALVAWPADYIVSYMLVVIEWLSGVAWAQTDVRIDVTGLVVMVGAIVGAGVLLWRKLRYDYFSSGIID
jgi:competence protein ComEC